MARAYAYANGDGPFVSELEKLWLIDRFGAQAVVGRILGVGEMRRMIAVEGIVKSHREREESEDWAKWAEKNEASNALLVRAADLFEQGAHLPYGISKQQRQ